MRSVRIRGSHWGQAPSIVRWSHRVNFQCPQLWMHDVRSMLNIRNWQRKRYLVLMPVRSDRRRSWVEPRCPRSLHLWSTSRVYKQCGWWKSGHVQVLILCQQNMYCQLMFWGHTIIHADVVNHWDSNENQLWIKEVLDDSKSMVSLNDNVSIFI